MKTETREELELKIRVLEQNNASLNEELDRIRDAYNMAFRNCQDLCNRVNTFRQSVRSVCNGRNEISSTLLMADENLGTVINPIV